MVGKKIIQKNIFRLFLLLDTEALMGEVEPGRGKIKLVDQRGDGVFVRLKVDHLKGQDG